MELGRPLTMVSAHEATRRSLVDTGALGSVGGTGGRQGWRGQRVGWRLLKVRRLIWNRVVDPLQGDGELDPEGGCETRKESRIRARVKQAGDVLEQFQRKNVGDRSVLMPSPHGLEGRGPYGVYFRSWSRWAMERSGAGPTVYQSKSISGAPGKEALPRSCLKASSPSM